MTEHADFVLPGSLNNPRGVQDLMVPVLYAQSRVWNHRCLESPLYGLWDQVLRNLLFDCAPHAFVVPQLTIYEAETSLDPDISTNTAAENVKERIPDFAAVTTVTRVRGSRLPNPQFPEDYNKWREMRMVSAMPIIIAQLKRSPPRSIEDDEEFREALISLLNTAMAEADECASILFADRPGLREVVLIAASGEWWAFKFAHREDYNKTFLGGLEERSKREASLKKKSGPKKKSDTPRAFPGVPVPYYRHKKLEGYMIANSVANVQQAMPDGRESWSDASLLGMPASNQRFYLVHEKIKELQAQVAKDVEQATASADASEDSEDELAMAPVHWRGT